MRFIKATIDNCITIFYFIRVENFIGILQQLKFSNMPVISFITNRMHQRNPLSI